jgi:putative MATE family efflux protein
MSMAGRERLMGDSAFYATMVRVALPIAAQQLVMTALNAVDVLMIGQLGEQPVAAIGLANQVFFLLSIFLFGVGSGSAIFSAQFWGRGDLQNLRRVLGLALVLATAGATVFCLLAVFVPQKVLGLYTEDVAVIALGSRYLRVVGLCYIPIAITTMYGIILRSTRHVKVPMLVSIAALTFKTILGYGLIFGLAGLPALGILGAGIATCIGRFVECAAMLVVTYARRLPAAARPREMVGLKLPFLGQFVRTALPVILGELLWSLGITTYAGVYAHIGTQSVAAVNIASTIEGIALVPFIGLGNACAILLGNCIGAGETQSAASYARRFLALAIGGGLAVGLLILILSGKVLELYRISAEAQHYAHNVLLVISGALWLKAANLVMIVGIMRSGGDTRFAMVADTGPLWVIGVPLALFGAFVLHLPVYWVALLVITDEATKFIISLWRVLSGRWINNVVQAL